MGVLKIAGVPVKVCLDAISKKTLRVAVLPRNESVKKTFSAIDLDEREWGEPRLSVSEAGGDGKFVAKYDRHIVEIDSVSISNDNDATEPDFFKVSVTDGNVSFAINITRGGRILQQLTVSKTTGAVKFPLGGGRLYGLGHGFARHFDRRGGVYDMQTNGQVRGIVENYSATSPAPLVISTGGWALYFHQPWKSVIDLRGENGGFYQKPLEPSAYADIFVIYARSPEDAAAEYYGFTGVPPMPPKYAFGYQQSYRTLVHNGVNYVMKTAKYMRDNGIPCDMLIYLGTGYCEYGWNIYNGVFEWNPASFPEPEKTMRELHAMNYKISLHITGCHTGLHGRIGDKDVSPLEYDHAKNYWAKHAKLYAQSKNECWWPDDADEIDMRARLDRWRMYYEGSLSLNPDVRPFQMQRNTFPGANKWGGAIWTGDVLSEWETLKNQVPIGLNAALSSSPYWGTDTGGFFSSPEFDGELFVRWFQYSAFTPFIRSHGRPSFLHNLWGWTEFSSAGEIPPESAGGVRGEGPPRADALPDGRVAPICINMLKNRYELLPYIYNLAYETRSGLPMMRPMWYKFPGDETAAGLGDQYFFGDSLLVAPVTAKGAEARDVYFPEGVFYNYWSGDKVKGGGYRAVDAGLGQIPVFVPAGGMIAKTAFAQYVDTSKKDGFDDLTIVIYRGKDGSYALYEDDGVSLGYLRGENTVTKFAWNDKAKSLSADGKSTIFPGRKRNIKIRLMPESREFSISVKY